MSNANPFNIIMLKKSNVRTALRTFVHQAPGDETGRRVPTSLYYLGSSMSNAKSFYYYYAHEQVVPRLHFRPAIPGCTGATFSLVRSSLILCSRTFSATNALRFFLHYTRLWNRRKGGYGVTAIRGCTGATLSLVRYFLMLCSR